MSAAEAVVAVQLALLLSVLLTAAMFGGVAWLAGRSIRRAVMAGRPLPGWALRWQRAKFAVRHPGLWQELRALDGARRRGPDVRVRRERDS